MTDCELTGQECEFVEDCTKLKDRMDGLDMGFRCPVVFKEDECLEEWFRKFMKAIFIDNDLDEIPKIKEAMDEACSDCPNIDKHRAFIEGMK